MREGLLALVATVAAAQVAVVLLRPRAGVLEPATVSAQAHFTPAQLERARAYQRPQLILFVAGLVVQGGVLIALVRRPPGRLAAAGRRRPLLAVAGVAAGLSLGLTAAGLPLDAISRQRALNVGLATQSWPAWGLDVAKASAVGAALAAGGGALLLALVRRFPRHWWAPGSVGVVALAAVFLYAGPVVLDPLFNRFRPLPQGQTRSDVLELARRGGVTVRDVLVVDASRRTTAANAYVTGLGSTRRVVLYDTLLENFTRDEVRLVVAHELGHVRFRDLPGGLLYLALVAPVALFGAQRLSERLTPEGRSGTPSALPALALSLAVVSGVVGVVSSQLSRRVEARADSFALRLTDAPRALIDFERRIVMRNVADPDPPGWLVFLLGTHPSAVERIGAAVAYERRGAAAGAPEPRPAAPPPSPRTPGGS